MKLSILRSPINTIQLRAVDHPDSTELNLKLYDIVNKNLTNEVNGGGYRTDFNLHKKGIDDLTNWIETLLPFIAFEFSGGNKDVTSDILDWDSLGFNPNSFKIKECWGIHYNKTQSVVEHNHFPYTMSFLYCVTAPEGSSPFVIEGNQINPIPGRIMFFLPHQYHNTLPNESDGRCMITGNILYVN